MGIDDNGGGVNMSWQEILEQWHELMNKAKLDGDDLTELLCLGRIQAIQMHLELMGELIGRISVTYSCGGKHE